MEGARPVIALLARWGVPERWRTPALIAMAIVAAALLYGAVRGGWAVFDWLNDRQAVQRDRAAATAVVRGRQIETERAADKAKAARDAGAAEDQRRLMEAANAATGNLTAADAFFDELRRQDADRTP